LNFALSVSPVPGTSVYVNVDESTSVEVSVPTCVLVGWFSATVAGDSAMFVTGSEPSRTWTVNVCSRVPPCPSSVRTRIA
jgi:hypothetical protein